MSLSDETFLASIQDEDLPKKYRTFLRTETIKIRKAFNSERATLKEQYEKGIEVLDQHDELLNLGIFPFIQNYPPRQLGYKLGNAIRYWKMISATLIA